GADAARQDEVLRAGAPAVRAGPAAPRRPGPVAGLAPRRGPDHPGEGGMMSALGGIGGRTVRRPKSCHDLSHVRQPARALDVTSDPVRPARGYIMPRTA